MEVNQFKLFPSRLSTAKAQLPTVALAEMPAMLMYAVAPLAVIVALAASVTCVLL
jgi:hypothetical protein